MADDLEMWTRDGNWRLEDLAAFRNFTGVLRVDGIGLRVTRQGENDPIYRFRAVHVLYTDKASRAAMESYASRQPAE